MARLAVSALSGLLFAFGLGISGMTDANKVLAFLNVAGPWDYRLALVMAAAIAVFAPVYQLYRRQSQPVLGGECSVPTNRSIDSKVLVGATIFGVGWGMGGYCPGPGIVSLPSGGFKALTFVATLSLGMLLHHWWTKRNSPSDRGNASVESSPAAP